MQFGKNDWINFDRGTERQWILTNGIGGYSSSTIIGANIRKYHGLLVACLRPPVDRRYVLAKYVENIKIDDREYTLSSDEAKSGVVNEGFKHQQKFEMNYLPKFTYAIEDVVIEKTVSMVYGENTTVVVYKIINGQSKTSISLKPLINYRDHHGNTAAQSLDFSKKITKNGVEIYVNESADSVINIKSDISDYVDGTDDWIKDIFFRNEKERGLDDFDSDYVPGQFYLEIKPREEKVVTIIASTNNLSSYDFSKNDLGYKLIEKEEKRLNKLVKKAGFKDDFANRLVIAADNFIVNRESTNSKTVIAGYPWFTDWGRDTMIALPGLTLCTNRFDDAKDILYTFSKYLKNGLIPNCFPDEGQDPMYNTVDAPMWYFIAVHSYLKYTEDYDFIEKTIYPVLEEIANAYMNGTDNNTYMDSDGLIWAGTEGTQLTWMDVKIDGWVATPRHGKAVEINALWYNALNIMIELGKKFGKDTTKYKKISSKVKKSFVEQFWNENTNSLYDVINENGKSELIRPNQIIAISLPYDIINKKMSTGVLDIVYKELYATYGLRSLARNEENYVGIYDGDVHKRDAAYHNGTVWGWLIGPFITAYSKVYGDSKSGQSSVEKFITPFIDHIKFDCINSIAEIFDGDEPIYPRGCFAQAWSVSEVLRVYKELLHKKH